MPNKPASALPFDAVVFDLDGSLYPFDQHYKKACIDAFEAAHRTAITARFNGTYGQAHAWVALHGVHAQAPRGLERLVEQARLKLRADFIRPDLKLREELLRLKKPMWILSNSDPRWMSEVTKRLGINDLFPRNHRLSAYREFEKSKKNSLLYYELLVRLGFVEKPNRLLVVDDTGENLLAAARSGVVTALISAATTERPPHFSHMAPSVAKLLHSLNPPRPAAAATGPKPA